jgi:hypothetical protein
MSIYNKITIIIDEHVDNFIEQLSILHGLDKNELRNLWSNNSTGNNKNSTGKVTPPKDISMDPVSLNKLLVSDLKAMCKERGIKSCGTKKTIISLLCGEESTEVPKNDQSKSKTSTPPVIKKISASIPVICISRNKFGNSEHRETTFVFDKKKKVYGKQNSDGTIDSLILDDINLCNKYKFSYILPSNLDQKDGLNDTKIDELDEDSDEELDEDEDEDEELEEENDEEELLEDNEEY